VGPDRLGPIMGAERIDKTLSELNASKYSYRDIRKKFLKRIKFPKDWIIDLPKSV